MPQAELEIGKQRYPLQPRIGAEGFIRSFMLKLPPQTPPGQTEAVVHIGERSYKAVIDVAEQVKVLAEPREVTFVGKRGSNAAATVRVTNVGNVGRTMEGTQTIVLRHADAISRSVTRAFHEKEGDVVSRLIDLGKHLSEEPALEVKVDIKADFGNLAAGDERTVEISTQIPDDLDQSIKWRGNLTLLGAPLTVTIAAQE